MASSSEFHTRPALAQPPPSSRSPQSSPCHEDVPRLDVTVNQLPGVQMHQPGHHVLQEPPARLWRQMPKAMLLDIIVEIPTQKLHLDVSDALAGHEVNLVPPRNKTKKKQKNRKHIKRTKLKTQLRHCSCPSSIPHTDRSVLAGDAAGPASSFPPAKALKFGQK